MGDSVEISCLKCKEEPVNKELPTGEKKRKTLKEFMNAFKGNLLIGRGRESKYNLLPGYCNTCQDIVSTKAEHPYCNSCHSLVLLCGNFSLQERNAPSSFNYFSYPVEILKDNPFGLTLDSLAKDSDLTFLQKSKFKLTPNKFELRFKIDYEKKYYCPKCKTRNLIISRSFISWH